MKWQYGRPGSAPTSCPACGGAGFVNEEPFIRPPTDFTTGQRTGRDPYTDFQPDEPFIRLRQDSGMHSSLHRDPLGRWVQDPTDAFQSEGDSMSGGPGGFHKNAFGRWVQDPKSR